MPGPELQVRRWKRVEYERLVDKGVFEPGERVELIDGLLVVAEPQSSPHYTAIRLVERALARTFGEGWDVRTQAPIALDDTSEPEPDVAVVRGELRDYVEAHPADPVLVGGRAHEPCLRPRAQVEPLRPCRPSGVLDRQPDRPRARGVPGAHSITFGPVRVGLRHDGGAGPQRQCVSAHRPSRSDRRRRSSAVTRDNGPGGPVS